MRSKSQMFWNVSRQMDFQDNVGDRGKQRNSCENKNIQPGDSRNQ